MITMRAKIRARQNDAYVLPISIPELQEVKTFARQLHAAGVEWNGEAFGWDAEYHPECPEPPVDSNLTFTPADFCIGASGIWFFSLMWEHGRDQEPVEFLDDRSLVAPIVYPLQTAGYEKAA